MKNLDSLKKAEVEIAVIEACMWLNKVEGYNDNVYAAMPICLPFLEKARLNGYLKDPLISTVYDRLFGKSQVGNIYGVELSELSSEIASLKNNNFLYCALNDETLDDIGTDLVSAEKVRGNLIFWCLVMAAINKEFYKNECNKIADLAYLLGFTEEMISDWLAAVKYWLDGNKFSSLMKVNFKTQKANNFFKYPYT